MDKASRQFTKEYLKLLDKAEEEARAKGEDPVSATYFLTSKDGGSDWNYLYVIGEFTSGKSKGRYFVAKREGRTYSKGQEVQVKYFPESGNVKIESSIRSSQDTDDSVVKEVAAPKDSSNYTYFKLRTNKLTVNRRGKEHVFRKGDPLGWRFSGSGKFLRLISPLTGPNIIFSVEITDQVLKWLDKQDPNAKRKLGQRKSDKPEDGNNRLEGYVVTDGKWYYRLDPKPVRSRKAVPEVIHPKEQSAKQMVRRFPDRKLKVQQVYSKDLGKVLSSVVAAYDVYINDLPTRDQPAHNEKVKKFLADFDRNLKKNGYTRTGSLKRSAMAEVTYKKGTDSVSLNYHHGTGRYGNVKAFLDLLFNDKIVAQAPLYAPSLSELVQSHDEAMKVALRWSQNPVTPD